MTWGGTNCPGGETKMRRGRQHRAGIIENLERGGKLIVKKKTRAPRKISR